MGEWGKESAKTKVPSKREANLTSNPPEPDFKCDCKLDMLAAEGVPFDKKRMLKNRS
jgi:hypothetical protein